MRSLLVVACVAVTLSGSNSLAQARERVDIRSNGSASALNSLKISLTELLKRLNLALELTAVEGELTMAPPTVGVMASATIDFSDAADIVLQMSDDRGSIRLTRRLAKSGSESMQIEVVAHVIQSVAQELNEPAEVARRAVVKSILPPPTKPVEPPVDLPAELPVEAGPQFGVGAFGGARLFAESEVAATVGVIAWGELPVGRWRPGVLLNLGWNSPMRLRSSLFELSSQAVSARLMPTFQVARLGRVHCAVALGAGFDLFINSLRSTEIPGNRIPPGRVDVSPVLSAGFLSRIELTSGVSLMLGVTGDLDLMPKRFVTEVGGSREVLFEPWRVRPAVLVGLTFGNPGVRP